VTLLKRFLCVLVLASGVAVAAEGDAQKLVGMWRQVDSGQDNLVSFTKDGQISLYLRKDESDGEHTINGKWTLADDGTLTIVFSVKGQTMQPQKAKLSFEGDEMVMVDAVDGTIMHHRRHSGPLPDWAQWK
jgi:uncharacterized protein (TIGR03066 family)